MKIMIFCLNFLCLMSLAALPNQLPPVDPTGIREEQDLYDTFYNRNYYYRPFYYCPDAYYENEII